LSLSQKEHLLNAGLAVVDFDFITTKEIDFSFPNKIENAIFTSQNGVKIILKKEIKIENAYCVGKHTEKLINDKGIKTQFTGNNAEELGQYIVEKAPDKKFHYFCAQDRLETLPNKLTENHIKWKEIPLYKTMYTPKIYSQIFNGVLFYSPSGVESYFSVNKKPQHSFCIGHTTAKALKKYTTDFTIATKPNIENVLIKAIKHFKK